VSRGDLTEHFFSSLSRLLRVSWGNRINTVPATDFSFYKQLNGLVQQDPAEALGHRLLHLDRTCARSRRRCR
jgi:hypothetical protein